MPAVKSDNDGRHLQQLFQTDQMPLVIGQNKGWHDIANGRRLVACTAAFQSFHESIDCVGKFRAQCPDL
jgi:hypothetical protein